MLEAIDSVTRREDEEYKDFIVRAGLHPIGSDIKAADIEDNMDLSRIDCIGDGDLKRLNKYHCAMARIRGLEAIRRKPMVTMYYEEGGNANLSCSNSFDIQHTSGGYQVDIRAISHLNTAQPHLLVTIKCRNILQSIACWTISTSCHLP